MSDLDSNLNPNKNIGLQKAEDFGVRVINLYETLKKRKTSHRLLEQVVGCGTSIGANLSEAEMAISENDLLAKVFISKKECNETMYWLRLFKRTNYITQQEFESIYTDAEEIMKILVAITKTLQSKIDSKKRKTNN